MNTSLINKAAVRAYLLDLSRTTRAGKFTRVSGHTFEYINRAVARTCESLVRVHPSVGKTINSGNT